VTYGKRGKKKRKAKRSKNNDRRIKGGDVVCESVHRQKTNHTGEGCSEEWEKEGGVRKGHNSNSGCDRTFSLTSKRQSTKNKGGIEKIEEENL